MRTRTVFLIAILAASGARISATAAEPTARQREVAEKGAMVMPFDVHNSTHVFQKTPDGGLQEVVAKDPKDTFLIGAIRTHLSMEAARFSKGDYSDPMKIHGMDMPGLRYLSAVKPGQMTVSYRELPDGAEIRYTAQDPATVAAIHRWFDAQLSDHGSDATDTPPA